jgi:hypothetical protein
VCSRSDLSKATVREIRNNITSRKRKARTLEVLSGALGWHPDHLAAVLANQTPPEVGKPFAKSADDVTGRLDVIDHRLDMIFQLLAKPDRVDERLDGFKEEMEAGIERIIIQLRQPRY